MLVYPYAYDDLLHRFHTMKSEDDKYTKINLPVLKISRKNKLTIVSNLTAYSEKLQRPKEQIADFYRNETKLQNSINGQNQLLIQGSLTEAKCETIMRIYTRLFVMCKQCKGLNTDIIKEHGLSFLKCNQCFAMTSLGKLIK